MLYHWLTTLSFLTVVLLTDFAAPLELWNDMVVKHTWHTAPVNWESLGHPPAGTRVNLNIALQPERESALVDTLLEVSDPEHSRYGAHLSAEEVAELVRPFPDTIELITAWLKYHGIRSSSISTTYGSGWLTVTDVLVSQANQLLGASYQLYRNAKTNETIVRTVGYALPAVLHAHIKTVAPTTYFASKRVTQQTPRRRPRRAAAPSQTPSGVNPVTQPDNPDNLVTQPDRLRWMYKTEQYEPTAADRNRLAVVGFDNQFALHNDLASFVNRFDRHAQGARFNNYQVNGEWDNIAEVRASTAIQYATTISFPTQVTFYNVAGNSEWDEGMPIAGDMFLEWFDYIDRGPILPQTISIAYNEDESYLPYDYAHALCQRFSQLGNRGVSVLVSSGDVGVGEGTCVNSEGYVRFRPQFPASCPWVTSVGGTATAGIGRPEVAARFSGGGFSDYFTRPRYQSNAMFRFVMDANIEDYLQLDLMNIGGRGYPDISAQASNFRYVLRNQVLTDQGTVCAVSTVAGIVALINDYRITNSMGNLGFLNPWLYGVGYTNGGATDITSGSNPGCSTNGFSAIEGWDPVTGLGTPNFEILVFNSVRNVEPSPEPSPES